MYVTVYTDGGLFIIITIGHIIQHGSLIDNMPMKCLEDTWGVG